MLRKVKVRWESEADTVELELDHAMLVVPEGDDTHRVYFVAGDTPEEIQTNIGKMTAVVIDMAAENGGGRALAVAMQILKAPGSGEFRGERWIPPLGQGGSA